MITLLCRAPFAVKPQMSNSFRHRKAASRSPSPRPTQKREYSSIKLKNALSVFEEQGQINCGSTNTVSALLAFVISLDFSTGVRARALIQRYDQAPISSNKTVAARTTKGQSVRPWTLEGGQEVTIEGPGSHANDSEETKRLILLRLQVMI